MSRFHFCWGAIVDRLGDLLLYILTKMGGGPGAPEDNLVRFALPAIFWAFLLAVAWSRQRQGHFAREKLLVVGCGLALFRELFMLAHMSEKLLYAELHAQHGRFVEPLEHVLSISAIIVIAAAFLRYVLDEEALPRRYLTLGLAIFLASYPLIALWWPSYALRDDHLPFNMSAPALLLHIIELLFIGAAIIILIRRRDRVSNVVIAALALLFTSELIFLLNFLSGRAYAFVLCPIGNNLHIWAVPVFGVVYFHEQAVEKRRAERALDAYHNHLEDLVGARTAELQQANQELKQVAVLKERQRIASEMHDGLAQTLSTLGLKTSQTALLLNDEREAQVGQQLDEMQEIIARAVSDVRRSIDSLQQNPQPRLPLQYALQQIADETSCSNGGPSLEFSGINEAMTLDDRDQEQVLRVAQEALLNACRHAKAKQIKIDLRRVADEYHLAVADNGVGFDPVQAALNNGHHFGLSIMRARASRINGTLSINSRPGAGTAIQLTWPAKGGCSPQRRQAAAQVTV